MKTISSFVRIGLLEAMFIQILLVAFPVHSEISQLSSSEIEKRNAAATFANVREASLFLLLGECSHLMVNSDANMEVIAKGWFERNKLETESAQVWLDKYFSYLKSNNQDIYKQASRDLLNAVSNSLLQNMRVFFARKPPNKKTCESAAKIFSIPQLDFKNIALNPGYEQFSEFAETLARIRTDSDFSAPAHLKIGMDAAAQKILGIGNLASLDAANAAKEQGDGLGQITIYKGMAERGDGRAAQHIGLIYLNGQQVDRNQIEAYRWFYAAWSLSEMEGLNALGVMNRDGIGVPVNLSLAQAAFYLAKTAARNKDEFDRASNNLEKFGTQISPQQKMRMACMDLSSFDKALHSPIRGYPLFIKPKSLENSERRLGSLVNELAEFYKTSNCR
jgi:hypothetical protein